MIFPLLFHVAIVSLLGALHTSHAANLASWKSRSIYQTMTDRFARTDGSTTHACNTTAGLYCGGTWRGTIDQLDYIQGMGFDAVMISPIIENIKGRVEYGEAYHGYWPLDLYSLNDHFGTHQDLLDLRDALHDRDMYLMMDTVINNMAYMMKDGQGVPGDIDYSVLSPFNNSEYYHPYCKIENWNNFTEAQLCQTGDEQVVLPDLYTEHTDVQGMLETWATEIISTYGVDGLRIDAAKHVNPQFLKQFGDKVGTFITGEVLQREVSTICKYQDKYISSMPNYPIYFAMLGALTKADEDTTTTFYTTVEQMKASCSDVTALVSFSENHDQQRIANKTDDIAIAENILTFTMLFDGIPMIYQGQEQHLAGAGTPQNREALWLTEYDTEATLYKHIAKLNKIRKHAYRLGEDYLSEVTNPVYRDDATLAFSKGIEGRQVVMVLSMQGARQAKSFDLTLPVTYNAGTPVTEVLGCQNYTVNNEGELIITMDKGASSVFFPTNLLDGSGLCGFKLDNITLGELKTGEEPQGSSGARTLGRMGDGVLVVALMVLLILFF
ncbi:alpha-amylase [Aspergillus lucknowensis]|uniref:alpha-amylase n=1 Tax=Aspergillus lucknowensis TaxID=176173 RepID=A0ABR4M4C2_9EURO